MGKVRWPELVYREGSDLHMFALAAVPERQFDAR